MSKAEIAALSDDELRRMIAVCKAEQDEVQAEMARLEAQGSTERDSESDRA
jgi:hypothetical protein